jgi:sugar/nucleoside kinase (ribokinase family)
MINKRAIVAGHICLDLTPDLSSIPEGQFQSLLQPGKMLQTGRFALDGGGAVANTGLALHRLGVPTHLIAKIGADRFGENLREILHQQHPQLGDGLIVDPGAPTSLTLILNPPGFDRSFLHFHGANDTFYASDLPRAVLEGADLFHFGYPSLMRSIYRGGGGELVSILQRARKAGLTTSLDFSLPDPTSPAGQVDWIDLLANVLPYTDLFLPSIEELTFQLKPERHKTLCNSSPEPFADKVPPNLVQDLGAEVLEHGLKAVLIKLGAHGVYLRTGKAEVWKKGGRGLQGISANWHAREIWAPAFQVNVQGTTGAGDAAAGGFLASILQGADPETALVISAAAGACAVESPDRARGLPDWKALLARVKKGWAVHSIDLDENEWRKDPANALWHKK